MKSIRSTCIQTYTGAGYFTVSRLVGIKRNSKQRCLESTTKNRQTVRFKNCYVVGSLFQMAGTAELFKRWWKLAEALESTPTRFNADSVECII